MSDDDEFEVGGEPERWEGSRAGAPRRRLPRHTAAVVPWVVAAVVMVLAGVALVPPRGLPTTIFRLDAVGVLAIDASEPPEERWRVPVEGWQPGPMPVTVVGDVAVTVTGGHAIGLAIDTGETRWSVPILADTCTITEVLTCVERASSTTSSILRVNPANGNEQRLDLPRTMAATGAGADLITLTQRDGEWMLQRVTITGQLRWATPLSDLSANAPGGELAGTRLTVLGGKVYLGFQGVAVVADVRTGDALDEAAGPVTSTPYGPLQVGGPGGTYALLDDDGRVLFKDLVVVPDDDPDGPYELVREGSSIAVRYGGETIWQTGASQDPIARVDGALIAYGGVTDGGTITSGYDVATGDQLWSTTTTDAVRLAAGPALLVTSTTSTLAAVEARTGESLWSIGTSPMLGYATTADGLILHLGTEIVRLSWAR